MTTTTIDDTTNPELMPIPAQQPIQLAKPLEPSEIKHPITAAQAKVDAVAALTMKAYEKASTLELTDAEIASLQLDFPDEAFLPGAAGKEHLIYIQHSHLRDRLNGVFRPGQWSIVPRSRWAEDFTTQQGKPASRVYVEAMLVIRGCFVAEAVGEMEYYPNNASQNYGDAVEGAKTAALRRCCKELGVGLQAWKKEWCEGWWMRRNGAKTPARASGGVQTRPEPKNAATATPEPKKARPEATPEQRAKLVALFESEGRDAVQRAFGYFIDAGALLPTESLSDLPLRWTPVSTKEVRELGLLIAANADAGQKNKPSWLTDLWPRQVDTPKPNETATTPPATTNSSKPSEWFMDVIVPIPHKGERRGEYLKHPDTIGSLYNARHGQDEDAAAARQRLFGFVHHYQPKGWQKRDGTAMPPSESDVKFREALDEFAIFFEKNHPDEKL